MLTLDLDMTVTESLPSPLSKVPVKRGCPTSHGQQISPQGYVQAHGVASLHPLILHMMFFKQGT